MLDYRSVSSTFQPGCGHIHPPHSLDLNYWMLGPRMSVDADLNTATLLPNADPIFQAGFWGVGVSPLSIGFIWTPSNFQRAEI